MTDTIPAEVETFVAAARAALPGERIEHYKLRNFGPTMTDTLVALLLAGEKTGTFALGAEFEADPAAAPRVGDCFVITRFQGPPVLIYRITEAQVVPYGDIGHEHVQVEGPNARDVGKWRDVHWRYWGDKLRLMGREPSMDMPVIFQRLQVIYPPR